MVYYYMNIISSELGYQLYEVTMILLPLKSSSSDLYCSLSIQIQVLEDFFYFPDNFRRMEDASRGELSLLARELDMSKCL